MKVVANPRQVQEIRAVLVQNYINHIEKMNMSLQELLQEQRRLIENQAGWPDHGQGSYAQMLRQGIAKLIETKRIEENEKEARARAAAEAQAKAKIDKKVEEMANAIKISAVEAEAKVLQDQIAIIRDEFEHREEKRIHEIEEQLRQKYEGRIQYLLGILETLSNPLDEILLHCVSTGDIERVDAALKLGANLNIQDKALDTALHKACTANNMQMVKFLLKQGCDSTIKNSSGKMAVELTTVPDIAKLISDYQRSKSVNVSPAINNPASLFSNSSALPRREDKNESKHLSI